MKSKTRISLEKAWGFQQLMVVSSFRYCLGRRTYIVSSCVDWLISNWNLIDPSYKKLISEEIKECLDRGDGGDECDIFQWKRILDLPTTCI